jgi:beta-xylosidase
VHNYVVWTDDIESGRWSEPHYLNSFAGIVLQGYDHRAGCRAGPIANTFQGTAARVTEGPHLYRRHGLPGPGRAAAAARTSRGAMK